jgi:hypothetical protein
VPAGLPRFTAAGLDEATSRGLVIGMIAALEGAFVLARATQTPEALAVAGELCAQATQRTLDARSPRRQARG